jgi:hypothetical protein
MVGPARGNSQNSFSKYPIIGGSEASDARTPNSNIVRNLNPDFNTVRLQRIMESIQRMVPPDSSLITLAEQGVEAASNIVTVAPSAKNRWGEPSGGNRSNDQAKRARSEAASSTNGNRRLGNNDARWWITQNRQQREYGLDRDDLHNIIDDRRRLRAGSSFPPRRSPIRATTPSRRGGFHALAPTLR